VVHEETVRLQVEADGRVRAFTAMQAMGQGIETSYLQILAETLQIDAERIEIVQATAMSPPASAAWQPLAVHRGSAMLTASNQAIDEGKSWPARRWSTAGDIAYQPAALRWPAPTSASISPNWPRGSRSDASPSARCRRSAARRGERLPRLRGRDRAGNRRGRDRPLHGDDVAG